MDKAIHHFNDLFAQLGLPNDAQSILDFLDNHAATVSDMELPDADYWTPSQAAFLREALVDDSDWALLVDQLNKALTKESAQPSAVCEDPEQSAELERQQDA